MLSQQSTHLGLKIQVTFDEIDEKDPHFIDGTYQKGGALAQIGRWCEAKGDLDNAFHKYNEAIQCFQQALAVRPERIDLRLSMGDVYKYMKDYDQALTTIDAVGEVCSDHRQLDNKRNEILRLKELGI